MKVNINKTKIMVFRKRGGLLTSVKWTYNSQPIKVVRDFNYLGVVLNYTGSFNLNQEYLVGKGLKAMNVLLCKCQDYDLKPSTLCQLFDAFVGSIIYYGAEVWGYTKSKEIERLHLKFLKRLLKVRLNTCNNMVYGELGRYPLYIHRYVRILKYWFKLQSSDNIILKYVYNEAVRYCEKGCTNCVYNVKKMLNDYGFPDVFENAHAFDMKSFLFVFKCRIVDSFKLKWYNAVNESSMMDMYRQFKTSLVYEPYLNILPKSLRAYVSRLRLSVHPLRIQTGRYARNVEERSVRYCMFCDLNDIEDEYHFVCVCPMYNDFRNKYIKHNYYIKPSVYKYLNLLKTEDKMELINLSLFVKNALSIRSRLINDMS